MKRRILAGLLILVSVGVAVFFFKEDENRSSISSDAPTQVKNEKSQEKTTEESSIKRSRAAPIATGAPARLPAGPTGKEQFKNESSGGWRFQRERGGAFIATGGEWPREAASSNEEYLAAQFLSRYGAEFIQGGIHDLRPADIRKNLDSMEIIYNQFINGLPVEGSRVLLVFNGRSQLVYFSIETASSHGLPSAPAVSSSEARQAFLGAAKAYWRKHFQQELSARASMVSEKLGYSLRSGSTNMVYTFELEKPEGWAGTVVGVVDAQSAVVLSLLSTAHK